MRHPTRRYGNPNELMYYAAFYPDKERVRILAHQLHRDERTVRDWLNGHKRMPFWVPELIRLRRMEHDEMLRQMNVQRLKGLPIVNQAGVLELKSPRPKQTPQAVKDDPGAMFSLRRSG